MNDTINLYSYFDCTEACEFLYSCVAKTISEDWPEELHYLRSHDHAMEQISNRFDLPNNSIKQLIIFIQQNNGYLPNKRRKGEYAKMTDDEVAQIEAIINESFQR